MQRCVCLELCSRCSQNCQHLSNMLHTTCYIAQIMTANGRTLKQSVKLKWLQPINSGDSSSQSNASQLIGGHQFERVRAGQSVAFECNAAGGGQSKALRVRWFRLVAASPLHHSALPALATTSVAQLPPTSGLGNSHKKTAHDHYYKSSSVADFSQNNLAQATHSMSAMDESQVKTSLLQVDSAHPSFSSALDPLNRYELIHSTGGG